MKENPEKQEVVPVSKSELFPESPSAEAIAIVSKKEWQDSIANRVNEALYGQRNTIETLVPLQLSKRPPLRDEYINADVFAHEEAVKIDREADWIVRQGEAASKEEAFEHLRDQGRLNPPSLPQIEIEESHRRDLYALLESLIKKDFVSAKSILKGMVGQSQEIDQSGRAKTGLKDLVGRVVVKEPPREYTDEQRKMGNVYLDRTVRQFFFGLLNQYFLNKDYHSIFGILNVIANTPFVSREQFAPTALIAIRPRAAQAALGKEFLAHLSDPNFDEFWREWVEWGVPPEKLRDIIRAQIDQYMEQKAVGSVITLSDLDDMLTKFKSRNIISEEEYVLSLVNEIVHALAEEIIGKNPDWVKIFEYDRKYLVEKKICTAEEFNKNPILRNATKEYIEKSFDHGSNPSKLRKAIDEVVLAGSMTRDEIHMMPSLLQVAADVLENIFSETVLASDAKQREEIYIHTVKQYVETAGLATRTYFDNLPAVKAARERNEHDIS